MMEDDRVFRNELKYVVSDAQLKMLQVRLCHIMEEDPHAGADGCYQIRSMYFDDPYNSAFYENINGVAPREKWRIRIYNHSDARITLECKRKEGSMTHKDSCLISRETFEGILHMHLPAVGGDNPPLLNRFLLDIRTRLFRPAVIVSYERHPFIYDNGNVRVTFDRNIRSSPDFENFFEGTLRERPILPLGRQILEVKYDEYLPDPIYHAVQMRDMRRESFSKYTLCRKFALR